MVRRGLIHQYLKMMMMTCCGFLNPAGGFIVPSGDLGRMKFAKCSIFTPRLSLHPAALQHCSTAVHTSDVQNGKLEFHLDTIQIPPT